MTQPETAFVEVWARMLCAADVHVHGEDHPTWQQLVGEPGDKIRADYRKAAAWLLPRMTVAPASSAGVAPAPDQTALRDRIAEVLTPFFANFSDEDAARVNAGEAAAALAAVLPAELLRAQSEAHQYRTGLQGAARRAAVLPASVDRADVYAEAADLIDRTQWNEGCDGVGCCADTPQAAAELLRRVAAETPNTTEHTYLSTGCLHGEHAYCQSNTGANGAKSPAQCKFCAAPCRCSCHLDTETAPAAPSAGGVRQPNQADDRLRCPRCAEDLTDYDEDDHVFRTGDDRPYCSGECVIAAHRAGLPTAAQQPKEA